MYSIQNHRLLKDGTPVEFIQSPNFTADAQMKPEGVVLHDTAGRLDGDTAVKWFENPQAKASAHLVLHRDGHVTQMVDFNRSSWHAGRSSLNGRSGVNNFSIGIEIVNPGVLTPLGNGRYSAWFGTVFNENEFTILERTTEEHGSGGWMMYTEEQLAEVEDICVALFEHYKLSWVWPHWKVSPGRKVDTNPLFPLQHLQAKLLGRNDDDEDYGILLANSNQRETPTYGDNVVQVIPRGQKVEVLRSGWYQNGDEFAQWHLVSFNGKEGWVNSKLIDM